MIRRFLKRAVSGEGSAEESASASLFVPSPSSISTPSTALSAPERKQQRMKSNTARVKELGPFDSCIEACDELASTSTSSGHLDPATGLVDCSVLVSADGELLIIPQKQRQQNSEAPENAQPSRSIFHGASELGEEYESAIFLGNDLQAFGDKSMNGFSAKGWSMPAASLAMKQSADVMGDLADFVEDLVLTKKSCAAQENQMVNHLRPLVEAPECGGLRVDVYQQYLKDHFSDQSLDMLPTRVGPLSSPGGTVQATLVALENYFSTMAESDSRRWRLLSDQSGVLGKLRTAKAQTDLRCLNRQAAVHEMSRRTKEVEDYLAVCKEDAAQKWDAVHVAEEKVTKLVENKMMERSRKREQQRLEQMKKDEVKRTKDAAHGNLGATNSEIWDIVSAVAESMEGGSFEPMDLPQAPVAGPRDRSQGESAANNAQDDDEAQAAVPITSRHEMENDCALPELRAAALAADDEVADVAKTLLTVLSNFDTTSRSARLAAETCLVSAGNAQADCLRSIVNAERESIKERLKLLDELEEIASEIDVRADLNHYVTLDKKEAGGRSFLGDDDDGGVASALAVLNNHIDGNMGMGVSRSSVGSLGDEHVEEDAMSPEHLEKAVEQLFQDNESFLPGALDNAATQKAKEDFETIVVRLCKVGKDKSSSGRSRRSTVCYSMNAKRTTRTEIPSLIQFEGLCRVFSAALSGCGTDNSGAALGKMMMSLSQAFFVRKDGKDEFVKTRLANHALWEKEEFWDQALFQTVAESLTHSGVMSNFDRPSSRIVTAVAKKKSEWTEAYKMKWHDLKEQERSEAASQVHAVVFAQIGALAHYMMEFGCGLERSSAFVRRMAVRNQLPMSQRTMLLSHLMERHANGGEEKAPLKVQTPSR